MLVIFDFDNTLEEFAPHEAAVENSIFLALAEKYNVPVQQLQTVFDSIKRSYVHARAVPHDYHRSVWFTQLFNTFHLPESVDSWVQVYWESLLRRVCVFPGTLDMLRELREKHTLCILSDSDGELSLKLRRIEQLKLTEYFDHIFTSDAVGHNKPHPRAFLQVLEHYRVCAEECVMIGDNPPTDLRTAHDLGMHTVWVTQGTHHRHRSSHYEFVDVEIDSVREVPHVLARLEKERAETNCWKEPAKKRFFTTHS
jgi:putative hydrolase of the HAD superfamily